MELKEKIISKFNLSGYTCSIEQGEKLATYLTFLVEYNKNVNLTAITDEDEIIVKHFIDSVVAIDLLRKDGKHVDIGSGAGFPAVVLKIFCPEVDVTMVESNGKKVAFLEQLIALLGLNGIRAIKARAEDLARSSAHASFDTASARAVTELNKLVEYAVPLLKVGGKLLAYKGKSEEELLNAKNAIKILGARVVENRVYEIEGYSRSLIAIEKINVTSEEYPRHNKKIISNPL